MNNPIDCRQYSQSIKPSSIAIFDKDKKAFNRMMICCEKAVKRFKKSQISVDNNFVNQFTKGISPKLQKQGIHTTYHQNVLKFYNLLKKDIHTIEKGSLILMRNIIFQMNQIMKPVLKSLGSNYSLPLNQRAYNSLTLKQKKVIDAAAIALDKLNAQFMASMLIGISRSFFSFESACRVCCSLVCEVYAQKVGKSKVLHHIDVWKTLKRLGGLERSSQDCLNCKFISTCQFSSDFQALSQIYSYVIKVRMLADYREFFYITQTLWTYMLQTYIPNIIETIKNQKMLINKCFP